MILDIEIKLGLKVDLLLFLLLSLFGGLGRSPPCGPSLLVVIVRSRILRPRRDVVCILLEAAVSTVAATELEHDVIALVSPEVGNPLKKKMYNF